MKINRLKKFEWKRGSGELLSLMLILPFVLMMFVTMVGLTQYTIARQRLTYATYMTARKAVVCKNYVEAQQTAEQVANKLVMSNFRKSQEVQITGAHMNNQALDVWRRGNMVICNISATYDLLMPFNTTAINSSIIMMIENDNFLNPDLKE